MRIRVLTRRECPALAATLERVRKVVREEGLSLDVEQVVVADLEAARKERFLGSPSVQVDGLDIERSRRGDPPAISERSYEGDRGPERAPPDRLVREAIRRARGARVKVLFLCTGNSCRSQMAEGWARHLRGDEVEAYSAGIETHGLNPNAVRVMAEAGVDISGHRSKTVEALSGVSLDWVVTVCGHANETCPVLPGAPRVIHVGFDDPPKLAREAESEEEALGHYRRVRDEIRWFVDGLPGALREC